MKTLNVGLVGCGFMGRTHSNAFLSVNNFFELPYRPVLKTVCARTADRAQGFAAKWGFGSSVNDWRRLVDDPDIELIDIASPNDTHAEIAIAAAKAESMATASPIRPPFGRSLNEATTLDVGDDTKISCGIEGIRSETREHVAGRCVLALARCAASFAIA